MSNYNDIDSSKIIEIKKGLQDLGEAIEKLLKDEVFKNAIGAEMVDQFTAVKTVEWEKYLDANSSWEESLERFTDWEASYYLPYL